jgi:RNA polymerase sigma-70 factor (ECF subfamily)
VVPARYSRSFVTEDPPVIERDLAAEDLELLAALRAGDEGAFARLVDRYGGTMLRVARLYVATDTLAEDVVQETWLRVFQSVDRFEGRSSLRTWIFVILGNCARKRGASEARLVPLTSLEPDGPAVAQDRFFPPEHARWAGMWSTLVDSWEAIPDERLIAGEARARFVTAIAELPARYATVFTLRDVEGWSADEVCALLDISTANQRVLLHRARARIRAALEEYFEGVEV